MRRTASILSRKRSTRWLGPDGSIGEEQGTVSSVPPVRRGHTEAGSGAGRSGLSMTADGHRWLQGFRLEF
ncbi:splicing factor PWI domain-containing protein [Iris pallida]|uniref:Splicing factor PWI domain-containing protein n=1 Tax=Iris pallida TaxID=29817 RepID=A0AAX6I6A1_IRIPA|nr:splicing factor PWI domain-containing protein [Iris pallida]